ncbi:MAG: ATP-binding protein [Nanoarchaeota archaeon]|nr:ATP-binding protein [Nanoarchaeota archaeon]
MLSAQFRELFMKHEDPFSDIIGQKKAKYDMKSALIADRHVLIIGPPGIGKTTLAKNLSKLLPEIEVNDCGYNCLPKRPVCPDCIRLAKEGKKQKTKKISGAARFIRIQGSPDLSAEDLIGDIDPIKALRFGPLSLEAFTPGKIFKANNGVLFFDELNRCPEKLQNALLQVLQEKKATIGSYDVDLEADFMFVSTMNPEDTSTEIISEVLLDRFDVLYMNYPESLEMETEIVRRYGKKVVDFPEGYLQLTVLFIRLLRTSDKLEKYPSVRASLGLYERAGANALLKGKSSVDWSDIEEAILSVVAHRVKLKPSVQYLQTPADFIKQTLKEFMDEHSEEFKKTKKGGYL